MTARALNTDSIINETSHYSIHRVETPEHGTIIVKASRSAQPSRKEISQLENEYRILQSIADIQGVPRAIGLEVQSHKAMLMLEDFGGMSLRLFADGKPLRLDKFFAIARKIISIVGELHEHNIVHCDLKPHNIVINPTSLDVQIIDFGCSRHLVGRGQFQADGQGMTLAYIAPEQTGRVNRRVDHRTDYYSLGITFYELLSGKLPFQATDALEWVHAHIAKKARPLHDIDHHITPAISQIVERLMNKAPEERYQTTEGLLHDLKLAEDLFNERRLWEKITLGERDRSTRILLSQKIVGREKEIQVLSEAYALTKTEGLRIVSVHGEAGVGKSALGRDFRRIYADQMSLFGFGKADPRQIMFPFSSLASVIDDLVRQIIAAPESLKGEFVTRLESKLQSGLGALLVIAPSLKDLVCSIEKVDDATDSIGRLYVTISTFFEVMADVFGQTVIQLDDAHFIDEASAKAVGWLIESMGSLKLLVVLSYRQSEVQKSNFLGSLFADLEKVPERSIDLPLKDLKIEDVSLFLQDTLQDSKAEFKELADFLLRKSGGNPFFMGQVLKAWIDDQMLFHDPYQGWTWEKNAIESKEIARSVLDLLGSKIQALPKNIRYLFTMASCFPKQFSAMDLSELTGVAEDQIRKSTALVVDAGLVIPDNETLYRFAHEQIREAFYSLLNLESRQSLHAHVGLKLLATLNLDSVSNDELYLTAEHLNVGLSKVKDPVARFRLADLNLRVAQLARDSSAFELGLAFTKAGLEAGEALSWKDNGELLFNLHSLRGECEYLTGDPDGAKATFGLIRVHAASKTAQITAALHQVRLLQTSGRASEAMELGLSALEEFGVDVDRRPSVVKSVFRVFRAAWDFRGDRVAKIPILNSDTPEGEFARLRHELLVVTNSACYFLDKKAWISLSMTGYRLAMVEGLTPDITNAFLHVGLALATWFGWYSKVEYICANTLDRLGELVRPQTALIMQFNRFAFVRPWTTRWSEALPSLRDLRALALKSGEPLTAGAASLFIPYYSMYLGYEISESEENHALLDYLSKSNAILHDCALPGYAFRASLRGETKSETSFSFAAFDEAEFLKRVDAAKSGNPRAWYDAHKMMSLFIFGHYDEAATYFGGARRYLQLTPFSVTNLLIRSFGILVVCEHYRAGKKVSLFNRFRVRLAKRAIRHWAKLNPMDVEPYHYLVEAELAVVKGRQLDAMSCYERAAQSALKTKSWMVAGLIYERTARFNIYYKRDRLARAHAEEAAYCFERWGATAKVEQVRKTYGLTSSRAAIATDSRSSSSADASRLSAQIDLESILKSSIALSSELDMNVLSVKLTEVMMESSGASRAMLLLPTADGLIVKSQAGELVDAKPDFVNTAFKIAETIVIADTSSSELTKGDVYFSSKRAMSALSMPIVNKGSVVGVLYLENDSATNVFAEQLNILSVLASQAGIALENARLYSEVSEKARMAGELKTAQAVQKTLFPNPQLKLDVVTVTGFYEPASECGGDWWFHHQNGDKLYLYIGDATGHGAPAALLTSAARSAVALMSTLDSLTPKLAMEYLNRAIFETSKGTMNMTFFIGAYDLKTGAFDYCNASHEPPFWIKNAVTEKLRANPEMSESEMFQTFKAGLGSLDEVHGPRLGESLESVYRQSQVQVAQDDLIILFTDGVQDARNVERKEWGQRRFLKALQSATLRSHNVDDVVGRVVADNKSFTASEPLDDDIMVIAVKSGLRAS